MNTHDLIGGLAAPKGDLIPAPIREQSNYERSARDKFLAKYPEYAKLPHDVLLQYAATKAELLEPEELEASTLQRHDAFFEDRESMLTSDDL